MSRLLSRAAVTPLNDRDRGQPVLTRDAQKPRSLAGLTWASVGALGGIRTPNLLIRSQMLYPLSYERRAPGSLACARGPGEIAWGFSRRSLR